MSSPFVGLAGCKPRFLRICQTLRQVSAFDARRLRARCITLVERWIRQHFVESRDFNRDASDRFFGHKHLFFQGR